MRISDWSSDVCSSDLVAREQLLERASSAAHRAVLALTLSIVGVPPAERGMLVGARSGVCELGRASCRVTVCHYVLISLFAVSLSHIFFFFSLFFLLFSFFSFFLYLFFSFFFSF